MHLPEMLHGVKGLSPIGLFLENFTDRVLTAENIESVTHISHGTKGIVHSGGSEAPITPCKRRKKGLVCPTLGFISKRSNRAE